MEKAVTKDIVLENGEKCSLKYFILESHIFDEVGQTLTEYGVRVEKYCAGEMKEFAEFPNITLKTIEITELFMLLSEGTVLPCTLRDVLEDYLSRKYS